MLSRLKCHEQTLYRSFSLQTHLGTSALFNWPAVAMLLVVHPCDLERLEAVAISAHLSPTSASPLQAINFNDGFGGGAKMERNLLFNT